jgi:hypothetical protein
MKAAPIVLAVLLLAITSPAQGLFSRKYDILINCPPPYCDMADKKINRWAREQPEQWRDTFKFEMVRNRNFPDWVDKAYEDSYAEFAACHDMRNISPSGFDVRVMPGDFYLDGYGWAAGVEDNGHIRIAYWHVRSDIGPQTAIALVTGEIRNWMNRKITGRSREMWGVPACP